MPRSWDATNPSELASLKVHGQHAALIKHQLGHTGQVQETAACESGDVLLHAFRTIVAEQNRLTRHEDAHSKEEIASAKKEMVHRQTAPNEICKHHDNGVNDDLGILVCSQPAERLAALAIQILHEMLHVVIHSSLRLEGEPGTP